MHSLMALLKREDSLKKAMPQEKKRSLPTFRNATLVMTGLSLIGLTTWQLRPQKVEALDLGETAIASDWRGASFPVENFQRYSSPFGYRLNPDGAPGWGFHKGLDIAAPKGSYIRSWWTGEVVEVNNDRLCGTKIVIRSGNWDHIYCHLKGHAEKSPQGRYLIDRAGGIQIWEGQKVTAGMRIGRVGMTGRTTGPHLHWGLKYANQYVDPALVLQAMHQQQSGSPYLSNRYRRRF